MDYRGLRGMLDVGDRAGAEALSDEMVRLLHESLTMIQDLLKGYREGDLHKQPEDLEKEIISTIADATGKTVDEVCDERD